MRARKIAECSRIPKSVRYCPSCDDLTIFGFNHKICHSCCVNCGHHSEKAKFIRWCDPKKVELPWRNRKCAMSEEIIKKVLDRAKKRRDKSKGRITDIEEIELLGEEA